MHADVGVQLGSDRHAAQIAEISREYIENGLGWGWTGKRVIRAIEDPDVNVAVVLEGSTVIAFGIMRYAERHAHLELMAVLPEHRGKGIASTIVRWLEAVAIAAGVARILVECRISNGPARCFYLENGYHEKCIEEGMYRLQEDGIRLEKWLRARTAGDAAYD
jgi:GNAT superfamily N-acetyltransferase